MKRAVVVSLALALATCSCKKEPPPAPAPQLSAEQKQHIKKLVDDANTAARDLDETRLSAVLGPPPSKAEPSSDPCPIDGKKLLPPPPAADSSNNARHAFSAKLLSATLTVAEVVDPDGNPQRSLKPAMKALEATLEPHKELIASGASWGKPPAAAVADLEKAIASWRDSGDGVSCRRSASRRGSTGRASLPVALPVGSISSRAKTSASSASPTSTSSDRAASPHGAKTSPTSDGMRRINCRTA